MGHWQRIWIHQTSASVYPSWMPRFTVVESVSWETTELHLDSGCTLILSHPVSLPGSVAVQWRSHLGSGHQPRCSPSENCLQFSGHQRKMPQSSEWVSHPSGFLPIGPPPELFDLCSFFYSLSKCCILSLPWLVLISALLCVNYANLASVWIMENNIGGWCGPIKSWLTFSRPLIHKFGIF